MKKRIIIAAIVAVWLSVLGYVEFLGGDTHKYEFRFDKVTTGDLSVYVTTTGTISAVISVDVGTQVSGIVTTLYADFNSVVKENQIIALIDTTFLYQSLKDAEANLDKAQAELDDSRRNLDREKALFDRGLESQMNYDAALTTFQSNDATVKSAQATLDRAKINLAYATIRAPIDGVVVNRAVNIGQTVAASFSSPTLYTIANDLRNMQVQTTVDESDIGRVSIGQEATFTVDAYADDKFQGTVSQIRLAPQSIQNVVNYIVVIDVMNDQLKLMPGMTANVKILVGSSTNVMRVPNMALRFQPPADLIDTTGGVGMGGRFPRGAEVAGDTTRKGTGVQQQAGGARGSQFSDDPMKRRMQVRDSIQAAHDGKLSQEELRAEMRKIFGNKASQQATESLQNPAKPKATGEAAKFGVASLYPEYQKNAYVPSHESGRGRVWVLKSNGLLEPVFVRTGLNDGRYTEVTSMRLKPGDQLVLGATPASESSASATQSPLSGQGQGRPGGGGFR
ncbi:MAG TPA: efflux RND transporter periplasmic adaptor subunit [Bacteroidota bacterium]|nr:efflux RND transporter periplasmic adaptor subunit [Bacteroidota bacterium]